MITPFPALDGHHVRAGCDIVEIREVADSMLQFGDRYLRKVFSERELADCEGRPDRLAARFAAKEAAIKACAAPEEAFALPDIQVVHTGPLPTLLLTGRVAELAERQGWVDTSLSLSHAECHAMAVLLVLCRVTG